MHYLFLAQEQYGIRCLQLETPVAVRIHTYGVITIGHHVHIGGHMPSLLRKCNVDHIFVNTFSCRNAIVDLFTYNQRSFNAVYRSAKPCCDCILHHRVMLVFLRKYGISGFFGITLRIYACCLSIYIWG